MSAQRLSFIIWYGVPFVGCCQTPLAMTLQRLKSCSAERARSCAPSGAHLQWMFEQF